MKTLYEQLLDYSTYLKENQDKIVYNADEFLAKLEEIKTEIADGEQIFANYKKDEISELNDFWQQKIVTEKTNAKKCILRTIKRNWMMENAYKHITLTYTCVNNYKNMVNRTITKAADTMII